MCIKIIGSEEVEFNPFEPLENQTLDAKEIVVSYDPDDIKIPSFVGQMELMVKNGISCNFDIKVKANNYINGIKLEREIEKLKKKLDVNEIVKGLAKFHNEADRKLSELSEMCMEKISE